MQEKSQKDTKWDSTDSGRFLCSTDVRNSYIQTIGKGNFAKVKLARHVLTDVEVAVKIVDKTNMAEATLEKVGNIIVTRLAHLPSCDVKSAS